MLEASTCEFLIFHHALVARGVGGIHQARASAAPPDPWPASAPVGPMLLRRGGGGQGGRRRFESAVAGGAVAGRFELAPGTKYCAPCVMQVNLASIWLFVSAGHQ